MFDLRADRPAADLLDYAYPVVRVDDLVSDAKAEVVHEGRAAPQRQDEFKAYELGTHNIYESSYTPGAPETVNGRGFPRIGIDAAGARRVG